MKRTLIASLLFVGLAATSAHAQLELLDGRLWINAKERARVEYRNNNAKFKSAIGSGKDWFLLQRARIGLAAKPADCRTPVRSTPGAAPTSRKTQSTGA